MQTLYSRFGSAAPLVDSHPCFYHEHEVSSLSVVSSPSTLKNPMTNISPAVFGSIVAGTTTLGATICFACYNLFSFDKPFGQKKDEQCDALVAILKKNKSREETLNTVVTVLEKHSETDRKLLEYARMMQEDIREYQLAKQKGCCICRFCRGC